MDNYRYHLSIEHDLFLCSACESTRDVFPIERNIYTSDSLRQHFKYGSKSCDSHGPIPPHPFCPFHNVPFFNNDELLSHLYARHFECKLCSDSTHPNPSLQQITFFKSPNTLRQHYMNNHYACLHPACNNKIDDMAVFDSEAELRVHTLTVHTNIQHLSQSERREISKIDLFNTNTPKKFKKKIINNKIKI